MVVGRRTLPNAKFEKSDLAGGVGAWAGAVVLLLSLTACTQVLSEMRFSM